MRLSADRYPEFVHLYCTFCEWDNEDVAVDSIEGDSVRVICPSCGEPEYVTVIFD